MCAGTGQCGTDNLWWYRWMWYKLWSGTGQGGTKLCGGTGPCGTNFVVVPVDVVQFVESGTRSYSDHAIQIDVEDSNLFCLRLGVGF